MDFSLKLVSVWQRVLLVIPALLLLAGATVGFLWFFANAIAANAQQPDLVTDAVFISPADPLAHSQLATFKIRSFVPTDLPEALQQFELAAALSPNDYRYWFALARMRERSGDSEGAERAARRSLELAPNYAQVLWLSGNILLRRGQQAEAFEQMRRASELDAQFALHFVAAAAQTMPKDDFNALQQVVGNAVSVRSALVIYLIQNRQFEAATNVWQELPDKKQHEIGNDLAKELLAAKRYRLALSFYELTAAADTERPALGHFLNGGFENEMAASNANPFAWQIADGAQPQIAPFASTKHGGERSLIIYFNSVSQTDFRSVSQTVAVEGGTEYHFETFLKTEKLQSGAPVYWEMIDAGDKRALAKTTAVPTGDNDWQKLSIDFKTAAMTEAVTFQLTKDACLPPSCLITGKIWFDDFTLQKTGK